MNGFAPIEKAISQQFEAPDIYIFIADIQNERACDRARISYRQKTLNGGISNAKVIVL